MHGFLNSIQQQIFDVQSEFQSISSFDSIRLFSDLLNEIYLNAAVNSDILNTLEICLNGSRFQSNNANYTSNVGLIIGNMLISCL